MLPLRRPALFLLATLLLLAATHAPAASALSDLEVEVDPQVPHWQEPLTATVRGMSGCSVSVGDVGLGFDADLGSLLLIELAESCLVSLPPQPFEVEAELGRVPFGDYVVQVTSGAAADTVLAETDLTVHEVADAVVTPPRGPVTDAASFEIGVELLDPGNCLSPTLEEVTEDAIVLFWPSGCPILPPGTGLLKDTVEVDPLPPGDYEIRLFHDEVALFTDPGAALAKSTVHVYDADLCVPFDTVLCLNGDRFRVEVEWMDFQGGTGAGRAIPERDDTGLFWFFDEANVELTVKVLDGCGVNGHYWVFVASGSTVEYEVTVTDTLHDVTRSYDNELGDTPSLIANTNAFATCP